MKNKKAVSEKQKPTRDVASGLRRIDKPELFFGLVAALGTDLAYVADQLKEQLGRVGYETVFIKATDLLRGLDTFKKLDRSTFESEGDRIGAFMNAGNALRKSTECKEILGMLCIAEIKRQREIENQKREISELGRPTEKIAYIIYSLKTPEEVDLLRSVYGRAFYVVSAYGARSDRIDALAEKLRMNGQGSDVEDYIESARLLVNRDEKEANEFGQNVRGCFPRGDVFIDVSDRNRARQGLKRMIELLFGNSFITPTRDELGMFHAYSAALRSADLARQVGAVIASTNGDIVSIGCNEVPKANGGLYWEGDELDDRDFQRGHDSSDENRHQMVTEILGKLRKEGWLDNSKLTTRTNQWLSKEMLARETENNLRGTKLMSVIEFGRSVHAEMAAIIAAARRGTAVAGTVMYCTTFPCHLCARHIVASGIARLVYVEPYPKSQASKMYKESVSVDDQDSNSEKVSFQHFVGIAPRLYEFVFKMTVERKESATGKVVIWEAARSRPKLERFTPSYLLLEEDVLGDDLPNSLEKANISFC